MRNWQIVLLGMILLQGCTRSPDRGKHLFYLHGMIVETQGINAVSDRFGPYAYTEIVDSLKATGAMVHSEVRNSNTDFNRFCLKISGQIDSLVNLGVVPENISVIGASKGGMMAMQVSHLNKHPVNYVLLGANSSNTERTYRWALHGNILGIYESSDDIADQDYSYWMERSPEAERFEQLELHTGLGHGFIYRPLEDWLLPAKKWIDGEY